MLGFLPGFAYLGSVDAAIAAPRKSTPRERVRAGSVGIAGAADGRLSRGLSGRVADHRPHGRRGCSMPAQWPAALLSPGDSVRFRAEPHGRSAGRCGHARGRTVRDGVAVDDASSTRDCFTTVQDERPVGASVEWSSRERRDGLDRVPHRQRARRQRAGRRGAGGDDGRSEAALRTADDIRDGRSGPWRHARRGTRAALRRRRPARRAASFALEIACSARGRIWRSTGVSRFRVYLASRSTHVLSRMGGCHGRALMQGDRLALGGPTSLARGRRRPTPEATAYVRGGGVRVRVMPGPQSEYFPADALDVLERTRFIVSPQSNRMGYRLQGGRDSAPCRTRR